MAGVGRRYEQTVGAVGDYLGGASVVGGYHRHTELHELHHSKPESLAGDSGHNAYIGRSHKRRRVGKMAVPCYTVIDPDSSGIAAQSHLIIGLACAATWSVTSAGIAGRASISFSMPFSAAKQRHIQSQLPESFREDYSTFRSYCIVDYRKMRAVYRGATAMKASSAVCDTKAIASMSA